MSNPRFFLGATGPQSPGNTWLGRFPQEPHTVRRRPVIRYRQMFEKPQKPSKHGPFHTATTPAGWFSVPPCLASDCRCGWDATEMPRGETGLLGCSHRAESLGARKPDSHTPPPGNGPEPARRGPAHRSTRPAGGCPETLETELVHDYGRDATAQQGPDTASLDRSPLFEAPFRHKLDSQCHCRSGCRLPPASGGPCRIATTPFVCCHRKRW